MTATHRGQWATRLYILLLIISLAIITFYMGLRPQILTKTFDRPSFDVYSRLVHNYEDTLQCSCSLISSKYDRFVEIEPIFHQVCLGTFVSDAWYTNLMTGLDPTLSIYSERDYRRFLPAHLQFLTRLCQLSIQSINNSVHQFLSSSFITAKILSEKAFNSRIHSLIKQNKLNTPAMLAPLLFLVQATNHANAIMSAYGTNFVYIAPNFGPSGFVSAWTEAVIYDNECSCGLDASCTTEANFINNNSSEIIPIKGFKMGCTPSESFLQSTLECFYNSSCINLIQEQTNYNNSIDATLTHIPLSPTTSRFSINTTVKDLVKDLFVEDWSTMIDYSLYFEQCSPSVCSYTYIQQLNSIYTVTFLLSIYGGLTIILKWICPRIVRLMIKIHGCCKKRAKRVQPAHSIKVATIETNNTISDPINVDNVIDNLELASTISSSQTHLPSPLLRSCKIALWFILFVFVIVIIIAPFLNLIPQGKNEVVSIVPSTNTTNSVSKNTTTSTTIITSISSTVPTCQLTFQSIVSPNFDYSTQSMLIGAGDFNGDDQLDLVIFSSLNRTIFTSLGNSNGSFEVSMMLMIKDVNKFKSAIAAHFNDDDHLDLAITSVSPFKVIVVLGNGDGTFRAATTYPIGDYNNPGKIAVGDINDDDYLDIAVANDGWCSVVVLLGYGNGTFAVKKTFLPDNDWCTMSIVLGDFNADSRLDIAFTYNEKSRGGILFGYGDGTFRAPMTLPTGSYSFPLWIVAGDFNDDGYLDIAVSNTGNYNVGVFLGKSNGTFQTQVTFPTNYIVPYSIVTGDFNDDGQLDLSYTDYLSGKVGVLLGYGNGTFGTQMTFSTGNSKSGLWLVVDDLSSDGRSNLVILGHQRSIILWNTCECCASKSFNTSTITFQ